MIMAEIPQNARGRALRTLLSVAWVASISGITLGLSGLWSLLMDVGFHPSQLRLKPVAVEGLALAAWGVITWVAWRGARRNLAPPAWSILTVVALVWAAILLNRAG